MQISKFLVLGALEFLGKGSGYDIITELSRRRVEKWTDVKGGSIYFAIKKLSSDGEIREVEKTKSRGFPTKSIYEVTEKGKALFDQLQSETMSGLYPYFHGFKLGLKFNTRLSAEEIVGKAQKALEDTMNIEAEMDAHLSSLTPDDPNAESDAFFIDHDRYLLEAERAWLRRVIERYSAAG